MPEKALMAVGAHADDIELNTGGTLAKYYDRGYGIVYIMATNNMSGEWSQTDRDGRIVKRTPPYHEIMPQRKRETAAAAELFGAEPIHLDHPQRHYTREDGTRAELRYGCDRPDCVPPDVPSVLTACEDGPSVQRLSDLILEHRPEGILTHGSAAANVEHFATCLLVLNAYWRAVEAGYDGMLLQWPELGVTLYGKQNHWWETFVDVTGYWDRKLEAIGKHACQIPDPSRLDLPTWTDACGCERAEAYSIIGRGERVAESSEFSLEILDHLRS